MFWLFLLVILILLLAYIYVLRQKLSFGICKCSKNLNGKVAIITGSNIGIGFETAKDFADRGAKVILACRTESKALKAKHEIIAATGNTNIHYYNLDLSSLKSIREFAKNIKANENKIDILVNNAGDLDVDFAKTEDGLLLSMQVNYFGPFLLTNLLLPLLKNAAPSRIVNVASVAYKFGRINIEDLNEMEPKHVYPKMSIYGRAKLCTILTTGELKRRLENTRVTVNSLCPGFVATNIFNKVKNPFWRMLFHLGVILMSKDCWQGAQTQIYLAVSPEVRDISGCFFSDCKIQELEDFAKDPVLAKKLWEATEKIAMLNDLDKNK